MASFSIEDTAFAGVGLLGRKPVAALVWAALWTCLVAIVVLPFAGALADFFSAVVRSGGHPDPQIILPFVAELGAFYLLFALFSLALGAVVSCAVYRAMLTPEDSAFAYLRLGDQEIQVLVVNFVKGVLLVVASIGMSMVVTMVALIARSSGEAAFMAANNLGSLVIQAVLIWLQLRLSLAGPMTFHDRRFRLFESWTLTRGLSLRLLAVGAIICLVALAVYLALATLGGGVGMIMWNSAPRPADVPSLLAQSPSVWMEPLAPFILLAGFLIVIGGAILTPVVNAPWVQIWRSLSAGAGPAAG